MAERGPSGTGHDTACTCRVTGVLGHERRCPMFGEITRLVPDPPVAVPGPASASTDDFVRFCCGDPECPNPCERETPPAPGPACDGSPDCAAPVHIHGCFADYGSCDHPSEHEPPGPASVSPADTIRSDAAECVAFSKAWVRRAEDATPRRLRAALEDALDYIERQAEAGERDRRQIARLTEVEERARNLIQQLDLARERNTDKGMLARIDFAIGATLDLRAVLADEEDARP